MGDTTKRQALSDTPKRGNDAWKAHKEAIATRNEQAHKAGRQRRQLKDDRHAALIRAADMAERVELAKLNR